MKAKDLGSAGEANLEGAIRLGRYEKVRAATIAARVATIKRGLNAVLIKKLAGDMSVPQERLYLTLGLARATVVRKIKNRRRMDADDSERVLGLADLIGQVEEMVVRSGDPKGFDAAKWVAQWLEQPVAALGDKRPAEWMDTAAGQRLVSETLARMESGSYA
jgi:putative toxin-antitoxin system antitoxin component (TIGR02293 family)